MRSSSKGQAKRSNTGALLWRFSALCVGALLLIGINISFGSHSETSQQLVDSVAPTVELQPQQWKLQDGPMQQATNTLPVVEASIPRKGAAAKKAKHRDLSALRVQRRNLTKWIKEAASYEEVRYVSWFQRWLSRKPRHVVADKLAELVTPGEWQDCSDERSKCRCPSGKVRFGSPEKNAWVEAQPKSKAQVEFACEVVTFGTDPIRGEDKICQCAELLCPDGQPANFNRCPKGDPRCAAACSREWVPHRGGAVPRSALCQTPGVTHELLWSCNPSESRNPKPDHPDATKQDFLYKSTAEFCGRPEISDQLDTYLDCSFLDNYLAFTSEDSEWLQEAYVSYIGGKKHTVHERRTTNQIRSVEAFSTRPLVLVVVDGNYEPPVFWRKFKSLIVYRMHEFPKKLPFNINKLRAMVATRVGTGAELDGDSLIFSGMDNMFAPTRREVTPEYPFPLLPVHFGPQDTMFNRYDGPRSMRWNHAHPTWTHWAIPFMMNVYYWRIAAQALKGTSVELWNIQATRDGKALASAANIDELVKRGKTGREVKEAEILNWMTSDEPMTNVMLWMAGAKKAWCKYDLEPWLYLKRNRIATNMYADAKWYPEGVPLIFYSMHNTKQDKDTDLLVSLLIFCGELDMPLKVDCSQRRNFDAYCGVEGFENPRLQHWRNSNPDEFTAGMCCCVEPRPTAPFFWGGKWYKTGADVPTHRNKPRGCVLP